MGLRAAATAEYERVQAELEATRKREEAKRLDIARMDLRRLLETSLGVTPEEWDGETAIVDDVYFILTGTDDPFDDDEDGFVLRACRPCPECGSELRSHPIKSLWALGKWLAGHTAPHDCGTEEK